MVREVHHHVGVGIIESVKTREFLFGVYDDTYLKVRYQGRVNLIGGNHGPDDYSPWDLFQREINEEFAVKIEKPKEFDKSFVELFGKGMGTKTVRNFAKEEDIRTIRENILNNSEPFKDYFVIVPAMDGKPDYSVLYSVFFSKIIQDVFELARKNLYSGKNIKCEGLARVTSIEELVSGRILNPEGTPQFMMEKGTILAAAGTPIIMQDYLGEKIPNPESIEAEPLGEPRSTFRDYQQEFSYTIPLTN